VWWSTNAPGIALAAVLLNLAGTLGLAVVLGGELRYLDERDYAALAAALAGGDGYSVAGSGPTAYRPPGYPFLLAPFHLVSGGSVFAMRLVGVLAMAGSVWLAFLLVRRAHSASAGALAAVLLAGYPLLAYTATALYPQVPAFFLLLLFLELTLRATSPQSRHLGVCTTGAGLAAGLLILTVPMFGPSVLLTVAAVVCWKRRDPGWGTVLRTGAVLLAVATVLPAAWCARNAAMVHAFVPVSTNNGVNLLLGNNPAATTTSGAGGDIASYTERAAQLELTEVELDRFYRDEALDWITAHPADAAVLYADKVLHTFSFRDELATAGQADPLQDLVSALTFYPVLALAGLRVLLLRRWPLTPTEKLVAWLVVCNALLLAVFFTRLRLRTPVDGLLILLAATAVANLVQDRWAGAGKPGRMQAR